MSAVSGSASNFPSATTQTVLAFGAERSWPRNDMGATAARMKVSAKTATNRRGIRFIRPLKCDRAELWAIQHCKAARDTAYRRRRHRDTGAWCAIGRWKNAAERFT